MFEGVLKGVKGFLIKGVRGGLNGLGLEINVMEVVVVDVVDSTMVTVVVVVSGEVGGEGVLDGGLESV